MDQFFGGAAAERIPAARKSKATHALVRREESKVDCSRVLTSPVERLTGIRASKFQRMSKSVRPPPVFKMAIGSGGVFGSGCSDLSLL